MSIANGFENLPYFRKNFSYRLYADNLTLYDPSLSYYNMSYQTIPIFSLSNHNFSVARLDNQSYILSLPSNLHQTLSVSPGQIYDLELP